MTAMTTAVDDRTAWSTARAGTRWSLRPARMLQAEASVIIPAHNEESVILRVLEPLADAVASGVLEVLVVCNGCTDRTARIAATVRGVRVIDTEVASKIHALNLGDSLATAWPRVYLDADVVVGEETVRGVARWLGARGRLAARPVAEYDTEGASWPVRAYYRARGRMPSLHRALWGAGFYALSRSGHARLGSFPEVTGDDLWVDRLFLAHEKAVLDGGAVLVRSPRTLSGLIAVTRRATSGATAAAPDGAQASTARSTLRELAATVAGPRTAFDAAVYAAVAVVARMPARRRRWERDDSSR